MPWRELGKKCGVQRVRDALTEPRGERFVVARVAMSAGFTDVAAVWRVGGRDGIDPVVVFGMVYNRQERRRGLVPRALCLLVGVWQPCIPAACMRPVVSM